MTTINELEQQFTSAPSGLPRIEAMNLLAWRLRQSDLGRALSLAQQAEELIGPDAQGDLAHELVRSLRTQAFSHTVRGDYRQALAISDRGLDASLGLDMPECRIDLLNSLGWCVGTSGDYARALKLLREAEALAIQIGSQIRHARILSSLGTIYSFAQDRERAAATLEQALSIAAITKSSSDKSVMLNNLALAYLDLGKSQQAYETALESLSLCEESGDTHLEAVLDTLGEICLKRGALQESQQYLERAVTHARDAESRADLCTALLHLSQLHLAQHRLDLAELAAGEALSLAHSMEATMDHYQLHKTMSGIMEAQGNAQHALHHYRLHHELKEELFSQETAEKLRNLQTAHEIETARKDAEIHRLRNVELEQEIDERLRAESELEEAVAQLRTALDEVRTLSGLVPICASCKKIRSDEGYWEHVEEYITSHTNAQFSHGICPDCAATLYGDLAGRAFCQDDHEPDA